MRNASYACVFEKNVCVNCKCFFLIPCMPTTPVCVCWKSMFFANISFVFQFLRLRAIFSSLNLKQSRARDSFAPFTCCFFFFFALVRSSFNQRTRIKSNSISRVQFSYYDSKGVKVCICIVTFTYILYDYDGGK